MHYELKIKNGQDEKVIGLLKKFDFVIIKKKKVQKTKKIKIPDFSYFGLLPDWDFDVNDYRWNGYRKTKLEW